jgi:plastocyanin
MCINVALTISIIIKKNKAKMKNIIQVIFPVITIILISFGCKKDDSLPTQQSNEVWIQNSTFNPNTLTVPLYTTIIWTNKDAVTHTVTSNNDLFDSGNIVNGGVYKHQFTSSGTYTYKCKIHPSMTGTIIVQ